MELMTPSSRHPVGYYEECLDCAPLEASMMSVWLPLRQASSRPLTHYKMRISLAQKVDQSLSLLLRNGLPRCLPIGCLPTTTDYELPTALEHVGQSSPVDITSKDNLRGVVILAHGMSDGSLVLAHLAERFAALGFIFAAPAFQDSCCRSCDHPGAGASAASHLLQHGNSLLLEHLVLRMHTMEACLAKLRHTFGTTLDGLPRVLIGYSMGAWCSRTCFITLLSTALTSYARWRRMRAPSGACLPCAGADTVRRMAVPALRIYVGGPGWEERVSPPERKVPRGDAPTGDPTAQFMGGSDRLMRLFRMTIEESSAATGHHPSQRKRVTAQGALFSGKDAGGISEARSDGNRQSGGTELAPELAALHTQLIFDDFDHGDFKYPPFLAAENDSWSWVRLVRIALLGARSDDPAEVHQRRADESAEAMVRWVLSALRDYHLREAVVQGAHA
jgi:hypothetical protein